MGPEELVVGAEEQVDPELSPTPGRRWTVVAVAFTLTAVGIAGWFVRGDEQAPQGAGLGREVPATPAPSASEGPRRQDASNSGSLIRIDATGDSVTSVAIPRPILVAADGRSIWVVSHGIFGGRSVVTVEPATGSVTGVSDASGLGIDPSQLAVAGGNAWLGGTSWRGGRERLYRVAPGAVTGDPVRFEEDGRELTGPVEAAGSLWVACCRPRTLLRVNPASGHVTARIAGVDRVVASGEGFVWAIARDPEGPDPSLVRIDTATLETAPIGVLPFRWSDLTAADGAVWASGPDDGTIVRLDPATGEAGRPVEVGAGPAALAAGGGAVWVALPDAEAVARYEIGTERLDVIDVGGRPLDLVFARGSVWVAMVKQ